MTLDTIRLTDLAAPEFSPDVAAIRTAMTSMADELDFDFLARQFKLSGGNIKNIALAAAFLAAEDGGVVNIAHLGQAIRREYQKMGKVLSEEELRSAADPGDRARGG